MTTDLKEIHSGFEADKKILLENATRASCDPSF